jgi:hypothetical protein
MNSDRLKKSIFIVLLLAFSGVWLYNLGVFLPKAQYNYFRQVDKSLEKKADLTNKTSLNPNWGYEYSSSLQNPFMPFYAKRQIENDKANPISPELIIKAPYKYIGILSGNKGACGIIENTTGQSFVVSPGDTLESIRVLAINAKYMKISYQGNSVKLNLYE